MQVAVDATDLPRSLLHATIQFPLAEVPRNEGCVAIWYPKWVPGSHGPTGPVANVAGMIVQDADGTRLPWRREAGEFHKVLVEVDDKVSDLTVQIRYIANQPTTNSSGHDSYGNAFLGVISPSSVFVYPEGIDIDTSEVDVTVQLPKNWEQGSALRIDSEHGNSAHAPKAAQAHEGSRASNVTGPIAFQRTSIRTYLDSPILCGRYHRVYTLTNGIKIPLHRLHIFSEAESMLHVDSACLDRLKAMVQQTALLFKSHPFDEFDILLATTDLLPKNGLEHSRSSFNVLGQRAMQGPDQLKGWDRLLIPHEYIHAWCGKYRRPQGMVTSNYHDVKATEMLWVYEGLTQYLGELVEARAGWMSEEEFRERFAIEVRLASHQQGREWRSLMDTAACSSTLRQGSPAWGKLRRSQDYYMEGMLFWIEVDAMIRSRSGGKKSLDNFCQQFFAAEKPAAGPVAFTRAEIVDTLNRLVPYDWDGLIARRIESASQPFDPAVVGAVGYTVQFSNTDPKSSNPTFRQSTGVDALDSIGATFTTDGKVNHVLLGSAADEARLGPGMQVVAVNSHRWSGDRMRDAIAMSGTRHGIDLMVDRNDALETVHLEYSEGPRFMTLVPDKHAVDRLHEMIQPR